MLTPVKVFNHEVLGAAVSGREVHGLITKSKSDRDLFSDWFRDRIGMLNLKEQADYVRTTVHLPDLLRPRIEYIVTVAVAIRLAKVQQLSRGKGVQAYLEAYQKNPDVARFEVAGQNPEPVTTDLFAPETGTPKAERIEQSVTEQPETKPASLPAPAVPQTPIQRLLLEVQQLADAEQARAQAAPNADEALARLEARLQLAEARADVVLHSFEQAVTALRGLNGVGSGEDAPKPESPLQSKVIRLVNAYAAATQRTERDVWRQLYGTFTIRTDFDPYAVKNRQGRSYLTVIEQRGHLEALYEIAQKVFVLPDLV